MLKGRTLVGLAEEVERQKDSKKDFLATTDVLEVGSDIVSPVKGIPPTDMTIDQLTRSPWIQMGGNGRFEMNNIFHRQVGTTLKIPAKYYERCLENAPDLWADQVNHWLHADTMKRMVRTLDGKARAFLSDKYRPLDNFDLLEAVLPGLPPGVEVASSQVTDRRLYLQITTPRLQGEVKVGEVVQAGLVISNSEVGEGSLLIQRMLYKLACSNGWIQGIAQRRNHVGRRNAFEDGTSQEFYRDSTRMMTDAALFGQVRDTVAGLLSEKGFTPLLTAAKEKLEWGFERADPSKVIEGVCQVVEVNEKERTGVLRHLVTGGDLSAWGLSDAITSVAHEAENYDRAVELERAGGKVLEMQHSQWQRLLDKATA